MPRQPPPPKRDDRYKWFIREAVLKELYEKINLIRVKELGDIIRRNASLMTYTHLSFAYNGEFYNIDVDSGPPIRQRLHPSLVPDMKKFLEEFGYELAMEQAKVTGYLNSMLAYTPRPGDYLLLLPPAVHDAVRQSIICSDWSTSLSTEKIDSFMAKYRPQYELVRLRLALNLIL